MRAKLGPDTALDSTRAMLVWEPRRVVPSYAVPAEDIQAEVSPAPATNGSVPGVLHPRIPFAVHTAEGEPVSIADRAGAGFRLADEDLAGYVVLDFDAFDEWLEEDEPTEGHPLAYADPLHGAAAVSGHVAFWDELVDVYLDGEPRRRPDSVFSAALRDEFGR